MNSIMERQNVHQRDRRGTIILCELHEKLNKIFENTYQNKVLIYTTSLLFLNLSSSVLVEGVNHELSFQLRFV